MPKIRLKQKIKKIIRSPKLLLLAGTLVILSATLLFANKGIWRQIALRHEVGSLQELNDQLLSDEKMLESRVELLVKEEPTITERIARERYHLKRRGETIYREAQR